LSGKENDEAMPACKLKNITLEKLSKQFNTRLQSKTHKARSSLFLLKIMLLLKINQIYLSTIIKF